jgi:hypothetical protein
MPGFGAIGETPHGAVPASTGGGSGGPVSLSGNAAGSLDSQGILSLAVNLTFGVIHVWKMEDPDGTDQICEITAAALHTTTAIGTVGSGKFGQSLQLHEGGLTGLADAADADIDMDFSASSWTMAAWVRMSTVSAATTPLCGKFSNSTLYDYEWYLSATRAGAGPSYTYNLTAHNVNTSYSEFAGSSGIAPLTSGAWCLLIVKADLTAGEMSTRVNNDSSPGVIPYAGVPNLGVPFRLALTEWDELIFWNRALSADEEAALWNGGDGIEWPFAADDLSGSAEGLFSSSAFLAASVPVSASGEGVFDSVGRLSFSSYLLSGQADGAFDTPGADLTTDEVGLTGHADGVLASTATIVLDPLGLFGAAEGVFASTASASIISGLTGSAAGVLSATSLLSFSPLTLTASAEAVTSARVSMLLLVNFMLDYDSANGGLFTHVGKAAKHYNLQRTDGRDLSADLTDLIEPFQAADLDLLVDGLAGTVESWSQQHVQRRAELAALATARLQLREEVLEEIGAVSEDITEVLPLLHHQMILDGETLDRSTVTIGGVNSGGDNSLNTGNGRVLTTTLLDGVTSPGRRPGLSMLACPDYRRVRSELANTTETMLLVCTRDAATDGIDEGSESFRWTGGVEHTQHGIETNEGSGDIAEFTVANAAGLLANTDFEAAEVAHTPDSWDVDAGTAGTDFTLATTSGEFWHGDRGLKFAAAGLGGTLSQTFTGLGTSIVGNRMYLLGAWVKSAAAASTSRFRLRCKGTGYTPLTPVPQIQTYALDGTGLGGTYTVALLGQTTAAIDVAASAAAVQAAIRACTGLECVTVTRSGSAPNYTYTLTLYNVPGGSAIGSDDTTLMTGTGAGITWSITQAVVDGEEIDLQADQLPTGWAFLFAWVTMPDTFPEDFELQLVVSTPDEHLYVDDLVLAEVQYGAGIGMQIVRGSTGFVREDRFTFDVTNDDAGVIQKFCRQVWGFQFPSSATPSIADALAI